jgi:hypothetical protein
MVTPTLILFVAAPWAEDVPPNVARAATATAIHSFRMVASVR